MPSSPRSFLRALVPSLLITMSCAAAAQAGEARIVGGESAPEGSGPWTVALVDHAATDAGDGQFCGGTLIAADRVLTAAHCVEGASPLDVDVVVGRRELSSQAGRRIALTGIAVDPAWDPARQRNDLAILRLATAVTDVPTLPIVGADQEALWAPGITATVFGWGLLHADTSYAPDDLHRVDVPLVADATCAEAYGRQFDKATMLCAGYPEGARDSCNGDSGGPLAVPDGAGGQLLAGVVSWGEGCAQPGFPGIYSRVGSLRAFATSVPTYAPYATADPTVAGTPLLGQALSCTPGSWANDPTPESTYAWGRTFVDPALGGLGIVPDIELIEGESAPTYVATDRDVGSQIVCAETRSNGAGAATAVSAPSAAVTVPQTPPVVEPVPEVVPVPEPLVDTIAPGVRIRSATCRERTCTINATVTDREPSAGVLVVYATITGRFCATAKGSCRKTKAATRTVTLRQRGETSWRATVPRVGKGLHPVLVSAVDYAGLVGTKSLARPLRVR